MEAKNRSDRNMCEIETYPLHLQKTQKGIIVFIFKHKSIKTTQ